MTREHEGTTGADEGQFALTRELVEAVLIPGPWLFFDALYAGLPTVFLRLLNGEFFEVMAIHRGKVSPQM